MLKSVYLGFRKVKVQRVTVGLIEFGNGMYNRSGDGVGCLSATKSKLFHLLTYLLTYLYMIHIVLYL